MGDRDEEELPSETPISDPPPTCSEAISDSPPEDRTDSTPSDIFRAIQVVERDSQAIAESFNSLFASLRLALSEVTGSSVHHMQCFNDAAGRLQESVLDAAAKGNRYINSCLRLNEEMKSVDGLASKLKILRRNVDALNSAVNKLLHVP